MKKLSVALLIFITVSAFPQVQKPISRGNILLGGNGSFGFNRQKTSLNTESKSFRYSINPTVGYFIIENLVIGFSGGYSFERYSDSKYYGFSLGPIVRYYSKPGPFVKAETLFGNYHGNNTGSTSSFSFSTGVGYALFINSKIALEPCIVYRYDFFKTYGQYSFRNYTNGVYIEIGFSIFL